MVEVVICTMVHRLAHAARVLLPPMEGVGYLVSCQGGEPTAEQQALFNRPDVRLVWTPGKGLSRNRNFAFQHAQGDYLIVADDDNILVAETLAQVAADFDAHPKWDIIQYRMQGSGKPFPAPYVSSCELALRRAVAEHVSFDERFGLGSEYLKCGEEEVFVYQARKKGYVKKQLNRTLCVLRGQTTGQSFLLDARVQRSKGAVFALTRGRFPAYLKSLREALSWLLHCGANPWPLVRNMFWGVNYILQ